MRKISVFCLAITTILLGGCFPLSLNPIYSHKDKVFLPQLEGIWVEEDLSEGSWTFIAHDSGRYRLELKGEQGKASIFSAQLAQVEGVLLLDLFPARPNIDVDEDIVEMHLMGLHSFAVVHQIEPTLKMSFLKQDWLERHLERHPGALDFIRPDERLVLTSSTSDLQKFVIQHVRVKDAFVDYDEMKRAAQSD